jgi:peptide-methionine (S)-S-oxide reductase
MNIVITVLFGFMMAMGCGSQKTTSNGLNQNKDTYPVNEYTKAQNLENYDVAIFAGGCFWCTEASFERIDGVVDVISGYSGGHKDYPAYKEVGYGTTGHSEAIYIYYDKSVIDYNTLLDVFFVAHDPTTLNRQGPDVGEAYRSAIYYNTDEELKLIETAIAKVNTSGKYSDKVVTEVEPYKEFWVAEGYHQNFYELNPNQGYVNSVSRPKVKKVVKAFPDLIKKKYKK